MMPPAVLANGFRRLHSAAQDLPPARPDPFRRHRAPNAATLVSPVITPSMAEVERIVTRLANAHAEMPNNPVLGELAGRRRNTMLRALRRLEVAGRLTVEKDGNRRRCTILATGRSTDWGEARPGHSPYMHYRAGDPARRPAPGRARQPASRPLAVQSEIATTALRSLEACKTPIQQPAAWLVAAGIDVAAHIDFDVAGIEEAPSCQFPLWADGERPGANPKFCCGPVLYRTHFCAEHASSCRRGKRPAHQAGRVAA